MWRVIGMHFVCRDDLNVVDREDGTFETGFWAVALKHCETVGNVALHEAKDQLSYLQGRVVDWYTVDYEGRDRAVFIVQTEGPPRPWVGGGRGEKGYAWAEAWGPLQRISVHGCSFPDSRGSSLGGRAWGTHASTHAPLDLVVVQPTFAMDVCRLRAGGTPCGSNSSRWSSR